MTTFPVADTTSFAVVRSQIVIFTQILSSNDRGRIDRRRSFSSSTITPSLSLGLSQQIRQRSICPVDGSGRTSNGFVADDIVAVADNVAATVASSSGAAVEIGLNILVSISTWSGITWSGTGITWSRTGMAAKWIDRWAARSRFRPASKMIRVAASKIRKVGKIRKVMVGNGTAKIRVGRRLRRG